MEIRDDIQVIQVVPCMGCLPNKYSQTFNVVIFSHPEELKRDVSDSFDIFALRCYNKTLIRDKVGNFGQFDDKTLFGNESNLHAKIAFTHNISR